MPEAGQTCQSCPRLAISLVMTSRTSLLPTAWSSARATYSAASSSAPIRTWARADTGCCGIRPTSIAWASRLSTKPSP